MYLLGNCVKNTPNKHLKTVKIFMKIKNQLRWSYIKNIKQQDFNALSDLRGVLYAHPSCFILWPTPSLPPTVSFLLFLLRQISSFYLFPTEISRIVFPPPLLNTYTTLQRTHILQNITEKPSHVYITFHLLHPSLQQLLKSNFHFLWQGKEGEGSCWPTRPRSWTPSTPWSPWARCQLPRLDLPASY